MTGVRHISTLLLLAGSSMAAPRFWSGIGFGQPDKDIVASSAASLTTPSPPTAAVLAERDGGYTPPPGGRISDGILYLTVTVTLQPGESPPAAAATPTPEVSAPAPVASAPVASAPAPVASSSQADSPAPLAASPMPVASSPSAAPAAPASTTAPAPVAAQPISTPVQQAPAAAASTAPASSGTDSTLTSAMIAAIAPLSSSCDNAPAAGECATAAEAAPALAASFSKYGITSKGAQAAVIALEAFESGQFKYKMNHYPGVPGQGTRNMMSPTFVSEYATALYGAASVSSASSPAAVLTLVNGNDNDSFGSGAWFLSTKCPAVLTQFASSPDTAWTAYLGSGCIGTSDTSDRDAFWTAAKAALGVQ